MKCCLFSRLLPLGILVGGRHGWGRSTARMPFLYDLSPGARKPAAATNCLLCVGGCGVYALENKLFISELEIHN